MTDDEEKKELYIFGRDVSQIPCFRNSFLYGISGGIAAGLAAFLFTSRPKTSMNIAMSVFTIGTLGYWTQCRYKWSKQKFEYSRLKKGMQQQAMYEGTDLEKEVQKKGENV